MSLVKLAAVSVLALVAAPSQEPGSKEFVQEDLTKLSWLAGTWELKEGKKTTEETWLPLAGSNMIGVSHTYDAKTTQFFEFLRITFQRGKLAYVAQPGGAPPTPFFAAKIDEKEAVFENEKHDHPQRIRYEKTEEGVTATVSLMDGTKAQTFAFKRKRS